jgi:hypothetical protein
LPCLNSSRSGAELKIKRDLSERAFKASLDKLLLAAMERRLSTESLETMDMVVSADDAKHPDRAHVGRALLHSVLDATDEDECANSSDAVTRLFLNSMPDNCVKIDSVVPIVKPELLERFNKRVSEAKCSVEATFHGTRANLVTNILKQGLNPRMCSTGAYGIGAYVGTHAGTAHQYADPEMSGRRHMCVVLAVVGEHAVTGQKGQQPTDTAMDRWDNPTQYCFVDADRLYVSHVITYHVTSSERVRVGGGFYDPFEIALKSAISRAARTENTSGVR